MPGLNYGLGTAAFIPPKGIVLEAIDPAKICEGTGLEKYSIPEKERPSIERRAGARVLKKTVAWTLPRSSAVTTPQNWGNVNTFLFLCIKSLTRIKFF